MASDKPFNPTQKRLREARREGNVLKGQLFSQSAALAGSAVALTGGSSFFWVRAEIMLQYCLAGDGALDPQACLAAAGSCFAWIVFGSLGVGAVCAIAAEVFQVGVQFHARILAPQADRLDPCKGSERLFTGLAESWQIPIRLALLAAVFAWLFQGVFSAFIGSLMSPMESHLVEFRAALLSLISGGVAAMFGLSGIEYLVKRRRYLRKLSMSYDEVRRELKDDEGDPYIRMMRRSMHEMLAMEKLVERVKRARVVVVEEQ